MSSFEMQRVNASDVDLTGDISGGVIVGTLMMTIVEFTGIAANILVMLSILRAPQLRGSTTYLFVMNLCCTDLLASLLILPFSIISFVMNEWIFGDIWCYVHGFLKSLLSFASILSLCVISIERFYSIKMPMHYVVHMTPCRAKSLIVYIWMQSSLFSLLPLFSWNEEKFEGNFENCTFTWNSDSYKNIYLVIVFVFCYVLPGVVLIVMYCGVFRVARKTTLRIHPLPVSTVINVDPPGCNAPNSSNHQRDAQQNKGAWVERDSSPPLTNQSESMTRKTRSQLKAAKTLMLLIGMYLILWGPYYGLNLYGAIHHIAHMPVLELVLIWLGFTSFALNPFLYGWMNRTIREELLKLLKSLTCRNRERSDLATLENNLGSHEDFLQFLERTTCSTRITTTHNNSLRSGSLETSHHCPPKEGLPTISDCSEQHV